MFVGKQGDSEGLRTGVSSRLLICRSYLMALPVQPVEIGQQLFEEPALS